jgi:CRP-like cAMP-binding protein
LSRKEKEFLDNEEEEEKKQLSDGQCFGELALMYNIPRTASALTLEYTELFCIDKADFDKSLVVNFFYNFF